MRLIKTDDVFFFIPTLAIGWDRGEYSIIVAYGLWVVYIDFKRGS